MLSAPATSLARSLQIANNRDIYSGPVQRLILAESPRLFDDAGALDYLLANWPTEIVVVGANVADELDLPSNELDAGFAWADAHPVADAYHAIAATAEPG